MTNRGSRTDFFPELVRAEDTVKNYKDISQRMVSKVYSPTRFAFEMVYNAALFQEQPTTQRGRLTIYPCLQKTIERTSEEPKICVIKIIIKTDSKRSIGRVNCISINIKLSILGNI